MFFDSADAYAFFLRDARLRDTIDAESAEDRSRPFAQRSEGEFDAALFLTRCQRAFG